MGTRRIREKSFTSGELSSRVRGIALIVLFSVGPAGRAAAAVPVIGPGGIVNSASYALASRAVAPGSIAAVFGANLTDGSSCLPSGGCYPAFDAEGLLRTSMSGAQVTVNGVPAPIFYATPQQLGIQIPTEVTGTSATIQVTVADQSSDPVSISIDTFAPGLFSLSQDGRGAGVISHADCTLESGANPAYPGETIVAYATGLGQAVPEVPTGARPNGTVATVLPVVTIDSLPAQVQFSGLAGCCVGLNQINVVVPGNVRLGNNVPIALSIGGRQSNAVTIAIAAPLTLLVNSPNSMNFGDVPVGSSTTQMATFTNALRDKVTILQATVTGTAFRGRGFTVPLVLGSGQTVSFPIQFAPTASGQATGSLSIVCDISSAPVTIALAGNGVSPGQGTGTPAPSVDLEWDPSTSVVVGYNVYRSAVAGQSYVKLNSTIIAGSAYTDRAVVAGQTYFYVATAVDANGVESAFSNEAKAVLPTR